MNSKPASFSSWHRSRFAVGLCLLPALTSCGDGQSDAVVAKASALSIKRAIGDFDGDS